MSIERLSAALSDRYRIERELGQGGMATVYLAEDLKHQRKVALKVLKPELAAVLGAERFVQEITTTASLQHPHILPLFDSGAADGFLFYVMPFIDGETLRAKLERDTQLGVDEAVRIAREVADALDYAHTRGVVHRDVKPENILLNGGHALVADFGIALAVSAAAGGRMTETGLSLGTPHYMSPEQATAEKEITPRSDVYSLGSVLYEMLTGNAPFTGANAQQIIMKIITEPAEAVTKYRKAVPTNVAAAVARSLEKLPADRFARASEFAAALGNPGWGPVAAPGPAESRAFPGWVVAVGAMVVLLTGLAAGWFAREAGPQAGSAFRGQMLAPPGYRLSGRTVLSPDGRLVAFRAYQRDTSRILVRRVDRFEAEPLIGTEGVTSTPAFSPDGRWLAFATEAAIWKIQVSGGGAVSLAAAHTFVSGIRWVGNDSLYVNGLAGGLFVVPGDGGDMVPITRTDSSRGEIAHWSPRLLPGGRMIFTVYADDRQHIAVMAADRRSWSYLPREVSGIVVDYLETGHLLYESDGLWAVRLDRHGSPIGEARRLLEDGFGFSVAPNGTTAFRTVVGINRPVWVDRSGRVFPVAISGDNYYTPSLSHAGDRLVVVVGGRRFDVIELTSGKTVRINAVGGEPVWNPDDESFTYWHAPTGSASSRLFSSRADGSGSPSPFLETLGEPSATSWSPDGKTLALTVTGGTPGDGYDVAIAAQDKKLRLIASGRGNQRAGRFSPDGRWIAYSSDESGRTEVYLTDYPAAARRILVSAGGGADPVWSRAGRELFFRTSDQMMVVPILSGAASPAGTPRLLFADPYDRHPNGDQGYDVAPDGRFLMLQSEGDGDREIRIITNWLPELKRLLP